MVAPEWLRILLVGPTAVIERYRGIRTRELPNSFLERFELSIAIERVERFEPILVGSEAIAVGNLNFVEKVKSKLGFKAARSDS